MDPKRLYRFTKPSAWKEAPELFSYSSLGVLEGCPLRWQLMNSTYEDLPRYPARPREAAEVGSIVHGALEKLFRGLARFGLPSLGSEEFRDALWEVDVMGYIRERLLEHEREVALHPRASGYRLRVTAREVYNKTSLFTGSTGFGGHLFRPPMEEAMRRLWSQFWWYSKPLRSQKGERLWGSSLLCRAP